MTNHIELLEAHLGKPAEATGKTSFLNSNPYVRGVLIETPGYEDRARFGIAYPTNIPLTQTRESPTVSEQNLLYGSPFRQVDSNCAIFCQLLQLETIVRVSVTSVGGLSIRTDDQNLTDSGGMIRQQEDLERIRRYIEAMKRLRTA